jgi:hypothetical protein
MRDCKGYTVAKAFHPVSKDWNFYRDLFLLWPLILGSFLAGSELFSKTASIGLKLELVIAVAGLLLLVHEKRLLLGVVASSFTLYSIYVFIRYRYVPALVILAVSMVVLFIVAQLSKNYRVSYEWPDEVGGFELLIAIASIVVTLAGWYLITR